MRFRGDGTCAAIAVEDLDGRTGWPKKLFGKQAKSRPGQNFGVDDFINASRQMQARNANADRSTEAVTADLQAAVSGTTGFTARRRRVDSAAAPARSTGKSRGSSKPSRRLNGNRVDQGPIDRQGAKPR